MTEKIRNYSVAQGKAYVDVNNSPLLVSGLIGEIYIHPKSTPKEQKAQTAMTRRVGEIARYAYQKLTPSEREAIPPIPEGLGYEYPGAGGADYFVSTGDPSRDNPLNTAPTKKKEILVVSFGTSYTDSRTAAIGGIERALQAAYPDYDVRRAAMFLKLLRYSYSSSGKSFASQPFDIRKLFGLIKKLERRMANVVVENQDFETLIHHYDRPDAFFYLDPPYFSTEGMYDVDFGWDDHVRLRDTLLDIKGKFLLSYNDCPEIRQLYEGFSMFDFSRTHSMAQRYEAGKEFKELLIANYDLYEREKAKPAQLTLFGVSDDEPFDYEKILKECIISCKIR